MLPVVRPSPLRLWGFLLTVLGGALIAFGSIGSWAAISVGNSVENAVPTKGVDVWQGKATLLLGVLIIAAIVVLRFVRPDQRRFIAVGIVDLWWVRRKRDAGDAIDPDTLAATTTDA